MNKKEITKLENAIEILFPHESQPDPKIVKEEKNFKELQQMPNPFYHIINH